MKTPDELSRAQMEHILTQIQFALYGTIYTDAKGRIKKRLDRNKVWDAETIELVDELFIEADLSPADDADA